MAVNGHTIVLAISCWLSMIGSACICLTTVMPVENRKKTGKILLFWLSVADFLTSLSYFIGIFNTTDSNSDFCKSLSLLGIFFPVASFLWTDIIAFYLYTVIAQRNNAVAMNWDAKLKYFHMFVWGVSAFIIILVAGFDKEGRDVGNSWCWIKDSHRNSIQFFWEMVGGKFIEWTSCFIILPVLYALAAVHLLRIEQSEMTHQGPSHKLRTMISPSKHPHNADTMGVTGSTSATSVTESNPIPGVSELGANTSTASASSDTNRIRMFSKFYLKMAAVPIVFLFIRFWGSLRIVMNMAKYHTTPAWLHYMIDAFDPSQGFFNSILFVAMSLDGQRSICLTFATIIDHTCPCLKSVSAYLKELADRKRTPNSNGIEHSGQRRFDRYGVNTDLSNQLITGVSVGPSLYQSEFSVNDEEEIEEFSSSNEFSSNSFSTDYRPS